MCPISAINRLVQRMLGQTQQLPVVAVAQPARDATRPSGRTARTAGSAQRSSAARARAGTGAGPDEACARRGRMQKPGSQSPAEHNDDRDPEQQPQQLQLAAVAVQDDQFDSGEGCDASRYANISVVHRQCTTRTVAAVIGRNWSFDVDVDRSTSEHHIWSTYSGKDQLTGY